MILQDIVAANLPLLEAQRKDFPLDELKRLALQQAPPLDFAAALYGEDVRLIAEVKKASPSRGVIRHDFDPVAIAKTYAENGAAAISVLTEQKHFQGSLDYLRDIKAELGDIVPLLRKDFIHDPYQVYQSRACGADTLLLIVAMLQPGQLDELLALSHQLGMSCLVEVHDENELSIAINSGARIIGINNRNLNTFEVDTAVTARLRPFILPDRIVVSESGIKDRNDMNTMRRLGVNAVLVGESLMSARNITACMKEFLA